MVRFGPTAAFREGLQSTEAVIQYVYKSSVNPNLILMKRTLATFITMLNSHPMEPIILRKMPIAICNL